jgi:menaquinone-dependent protoporphyrinogen oxidase
VPVRAEYEPQEVRYVTDVLVAYATKHGSTQQVAEAVTAVMHEAGAHVTALPARAVRESVAGYDLVVLGAPLYSGRWHRDAHRFLKRHRRELVAACVAVFGMGPRTGTEDAWGRSRAQLDRALAKRAWLTPVAVTIFGGVDPPGRGKRSQRDLRNWQTIRTWATDTLATVERAGRTTAGQ